MDPFIAGVIGAVLGGVAVAIAGMIAKKNEPEKLDAFLDLDWDMDGESGEIYAKLKKESGAVVDKIKAKLGK
jgi:hypothetical protein